MTFWRHYWRHNVLDQQFRVDCGPWGTYDVTVQGGHSPGEPGEHGTVRVFKSGQGKVMESVFLHMVNYREYWSWHKMCKKGIIYWVKLCITWCISRGYPIGVCIVEHNCHKNNMHFVFYRYCCERQCPVSNHLKWLESGHPDSSDVIMMIIIHDLVIDVAVFTSSRHADRSCSARRFAVDKPRFSGRRSFSMVLSQDCLGRPSSVVSSLRDVAKCKWHNAARLLRRCRPVIMIFWQ